MNLIPKPQHFEKLGGSLSLSNIKTYSIDSELANEVTIGLVEKIISMIGDIKCVKESGDICIIFDKTVKEQGYTLKVDDKSIIVKAKDARGVLYAAETIRIMGMLDTDTKQKTIECCEITDYPRFMSRGIEMDVARYFFKVDEVKRILDIMAMHKLNRFHWHLTDDQGWRIHIDKYPLLTEIGSKRSKTNIHGWGSTDHDNTPHSGFYTKDEIREVVAYAKERGIDVLPEIDMPAHFAAAFAAYPDLACRNKEVEVPWYFGGKVPVSQGIKDWNRSACIGSEKTFEFIYNVIDEVCELFPYPYFHIGGDEAPKDEWKTCPKCQKLMQEQGLKNVNELQCYFINKINEYLLSKGRTLVGWNEVLQGGMLDEKVVVQYWTPLADGNVNKHIKKGGKVVLSKHQYFYLDMCYSQYPLKNTYNFEPTKAGIKPADYGQIEAIEGECWAEWIPNIKKLEFQLFPRMEALAECSWSDGNKNFKEFKERLQRFNRILDALEVNYAEEAIANPKNIFKRAKIRKLWYNGDQDFELKENEKLKLLKNK